MPIIPIVRSLRWENCKFEASVDYTEKLHHQISYMCVHTYTYIYTYIHGERECTPLTSDCDWLMCFNDVCKCTGVDRYSHRCGDTHSTHLYKLNRVN